MADLKPCPFCGQQPTPGKRIPKAESAVGVPTMPQASPWNYYWGCLNHTKHMHYRAWRSQAIPSPAVRALVDELRAYIAELRRGSSGRRFIVEEALAAVEKEINDE